MVGNRERVATGREGLVKQRERVATGREGLVKQRERVATGRERTVEKRESVKEGEGREGISLGRERVVGRRESVAAGRENIAGRRERLSTKREETDGKYRVLFSSSADAIMTIEPPSWRFTNGNPATLRMFNLKNEKQLASIPPWQMSPARQPDGQLSSVKAKRMIEKAVKAGSNYFEWTHKRYGGECFPATVLLSRIREKGKTYLQATVRDMHKEKEAEKKYEDLFDLAVDAIFIADPKTRRLTDCNKAAEKMTGHSRRELLLMYADELHPADMRKETMRAFKEQVKGNINAIVSEVLAKGNKRIPVEINAANIMISGKQYVHGVFRDISERRKAEEALLFVQFSLDKAKEAAFWFENDARITYVNESACKMLGYKKEQLLRMKLTDLEPGLGRGGWEKRWRAIVEKKAMSFETTRRRRDGTDIPVEVNANYLNYNGREFNISFVRDITERRKAEEMLKESEQKYRTLVENTADQIFMLDRRRRLLSINKAAASILGKTQDELAGRRISGAFPMEVAIRLSKMADSVLKTGRGAFAEEKITSGGREFYNSVQMNPVRDNAGAVIAAICTIRDISEQQKAREEREQMNQSREKIFLNASHELKTPITPITMQVEMLQNGELGPINVKQNESLGLILSNMNRLNRLITDILEVSRIHAGAIQLSIKDEDIRGIIRAEISKFRPMADERGLVLTSDAASMRVPCDAQRIGQVITNLLYNALKFTSHGSIAISAKKKKGMAVVGVSDTGIGISKQDIAKLFSPFVQVVPSYAMRKKGTGLGLSIARSLVEQHGGRIWVESGGPGKGAVFYFTLPLRRTTQK